MRVGLGGVFVSFLLGFVLVFCGFDLLVFVGLLVLVDCDCGFGWLWIWIRLGFVVVVYWCSFSFVDCGFDMLGLDLLWVVRDAGFFIGWLLFGCLCLVMFIVLCGLVVGFVRFGW